MTATQNEHVSSPYLGERGVGYFGKRATSRSDNIQTLRAKMFSDLSTSGSVVLDFGCGTGGVLARLDAAKRIGIELSDVAMNEARCNGIDVRPSLSSVADSSVDYVISFHALEHVHDPMEILRNIRRVLRPGGSMRLVVPYEHVGQTVHRRWQTNSDHHLFSWTPLTLGNLVCHADFKNIDARVQMSPTGSRLVKASRAFGPLMKLAHFWASCRTNSFNVVVNASK